MKTTLLSNKSILGFFLLAAAGFALGMGWLERGASAVADSETQFGMVSLEAGQSLRVGGMNMAMGDGSVRVTMRFDIYSLGGPDTAPGCNPGGAVAACTNNLRWLKTETCVVNLRSRAGATCDITADRQGLMVNVSTLVENMGPGVKVLPSIEVRENNKTVFVHPGIARGFDPQPDPPVAN
jgi:prepilin-type processing-associated H-X9-DG protein